MTTTNITDEMIEAGMAAASDTLAPELADDAALAGLVREVFTAMEIARWRPIATAPRYGTHNIMLGCFTPERSEVGIGRYVVENDDSASGQWSTESWWGTAPTHWMPMPDRPQPEV